MDPRIKSIDVHLYCAFLASSAACEILEVLPESDLVEELRTLITTQFELFVCILEGKHHGTDSLREFQEYCIEIKNQVDRIQED
jgi:hypothetical protein